MKGKAMKASMWIVSTFFSASEEAPTFSLCLNMDDVISEFLSALEDQCMDLFFKDEGIDLNDEYTVQLLEDGIREADGCFGRWNEYGFICIENFDAKGRKLSQLL